MISPIFSLIQTSDRVIFIVRNIRKVRYKWPIEKFWRNKKIRSALYTWRRSDWPRQCVYPTGRQREVIWCPKFRAVVLSISFVFVIVTPRIVRYDVITHKDRNITSWPRKVTWLDIRKGPRLVARGREQKCAGNLKGNASNSGLVSVQYGRGTT